MNGKGDKRRPIGKGLYNEELKLVAINTEIFYEQDPVKKEALKQKREKLKEELYGNSN